MSDVSVLSHEYKTTSEVSSTINRAIITLKKELLRLPGGEGVTAEQFDASCQALAEILEALAFH